MPRHRRFESTLALLGIAGFLFLPARSQAQDAEKGSVSKPSDQSVEAINDAYDAGRLRLERERLTALARLASRQDPTAAAATYEQLFRLAIANNLFVDAAATAESVLKSGSPSSTTFGLASLVEIIAECDRGEYDKSLESVRRVVENARRAAEGRDSNPALLASEKAELCDLYFQRLIHSGRADVAKKAFRFLKGHVQDPVLVELVADRLQRLDLIGKAAPAIEGADLDGKPFTLAGVKGKAVLVVFWATWCIPCADELEELKRVGEVYRAKGLQIVGVNLDHLEGDDRSLEAVLPSIRRFVLDYNVRWPTLINGSGDHDYAAAYGVTAIPSNTLINQDGVVVDIDLVSKNLESSIARLLGK